MKTIGLCFVVVSLSLFTAARAAPTVEVDKVQQAMYGTLLLDGEVTKSRLGARAIRKFFPNEEMLSDLIAERLLLATSVEVKPKSVNSVSWYIIVLGEIGKARYRDVLLEVKARTDIKKLHNDIDASLKQFGDKVEPQYQAGSLDLSAKREEFARILVANHKEDRGAFATIKQGTTLTDIVEALGSPDDMTAWTLRTQKLEVHYAGVGLVLLSVENGPAPRWVTYLAAPELLPVRDLYQGDRFGMAQNLASLHGELLVQFYKMQGRHINTDMAARALVVRRATDLPYPDSRYEEEVLLRVLKSLALSKDPQGIAIVRGLADSTVQNDGTKFARRMMRVYDKRQSKASVEAAVEKEPADEVEEDDGDATDEDK